MTQLDEASIRRHLAADEFFWLDLTSPSAGDVQRLGELLGLHPLVVEDTVEFRQRPKLDKFDEYAFIVFFCANGSDHRDGALAEVHLFVSSRYLVTVHREPISALAEQRLKIGARVMHSQQFVVYIVLDALTDTFFPRLQSIDDEIDALEDAIIAHATVEQLQRIFALKRQLVQMRKVIVPQRDAVGTGIDTIAALSGFQLDERDYFRDVYDHLIHIAGLVDAYRDLVAGAMDAYLSTVGNRQNEVMKQLTVVATIFLPLTFLTGFFGMNFGFLVDHLENTLLAFLVLAVGGCAASVAGLLIWFKRKRWT
ncbi:MAG TPA: magnesium/cobalt transporter CorA [Solirubrobacteraceae bacterium]|nr:magnesium/cobalt transporter CorA [Solirubrobacteraceae bacterium]